MNNILHGDCINKMKELDDNSVDAIVTDPPYGLEFMGKDWDKFDNHNLICPICKEKNKSYDSGKIKCSNCGNTIRKREFNDVWAKGKIVKNAPAFRRVPLKDKITMQDFCKNWAKECLRVLKPGGFLLSFGGTRTYHRMACGIEDAGFEVRDMLEWIYASGFPKNMNVGKAYDKKLGNKRKVIGEKVRGDVQKAKQSGSTFAKADANKNNKDIFGYGTEILTKGDSEWEGWGTALKPAHEPIVLARKPLQEKTIVENCIKHGTGALDIDGCRIPTNPDVDDKRLGGNGDWATDKTAKNVYEGGYEGKRIGSSEQGRFPANLLVTDDALNKEKSRYFNIDVWGEKHGLIQTPKASKSERNKGCEGLEEKSGLQKNLKPLSDPRMNREQKRIPNQNHHPTVKPLHLMSWLVRLVSKKGDTVLDPFMGSGTTGVACKQLDRNFIGIELNEEYIVIAEKRIAHQLIQQELFVA